MAVRGSLMICPAWSCKKRSAKANGAPANRLDWAAGDFAMTASFPLLPKAADVSRHPVWVLSAKCKYPTICGDDQLPASASEEPACGDVRAAGAAASARKGLESA